MIPKLKDVVNCPPDRGDKAYTGTVVHIGQSVEHSLNKVPFLWTTVQQVSGSKHVWPSHRLGYQLNEADLSLLQAAAATPPGAAVPDAPAAAAHAAPESAQRRPRP